MKLNPAVTKFWILSPINYFRKYPRETQSGGITA